MIIGISGKMGSGKDTFGKMLKELNDSYELKSFAHKLKMSASLISGIDIEKFEDPEFKLSIMDVEWNQADGTKMTVRQFLQKLGTDGLKDGLHKNVWINALFSNYTESDNWIITDVRFPEEADSIQKRGGIVIRIMRPDNNYSEGNSHRSETSMDNFRKYNLIIMNNGSLEDLKIEASRVFRMMKNDMILKY